ncbi:amidohydrolase family protein [Pandoraea sp. XJJ-1]|uniref:amidohydrolase family protein n=1 Tax=unclassified Pandoraea TaxID=2624094 RepID=UPI00096723E3|nr:MULTISPECIES: amidohydrolase family protein [unclassified Pandoraea]OJY24954.1 MAG: GntR family transcriptional regulator [Pandoraea sp. 64-18]WAL84158.1 amidohydrolase family protein [Pandoraea sp. XJJ-1]BDD90571.1 GntR family transcriptional regulator [Pandoraea sp. NE5]
MIVTPAAGAPLCLGPLPEIDPPSFVVPFGAVDTHAHVVAASDSYPMVPERSYTPPPAPEDKYLAMLDATGMTYGVLVQISVYGTDNRYLLETLRRHPDRLRGIAVVSPDVTDAELEAMHAAGVRGLRINVLFGGGIGFKAMETLAHRIKDLGWHMQFLMDVSTLPDLMPRMTKLPVPGIVDHMGHTPVAQGLDAPGFSALRSLVRDHGYWVKLSGAYRISERFPTFDDVTPFAQALIEDAPDRMVWGSDWPHVSLTRMPNTGALRNLLPLWAPDADTRRRILVDNPARLYGFPAA